MSDDPAVIAIDPGRGKCGLVVVCRSGAVLEQRIVPRPELVAAVRDAAARHAPVAVVLGDRTGCKEARLEIETAVACPIVLVEEHETTLHARDRYFHDNPPRGWRRLAPRGMLTPPRPVDDYAALLLGEIYWAARRGGPEPKI